MIQRPKGTKDILPDEIYLWQYVEKKIEEIMSLYGFKEIRTPVFESTELFLRGVGDTTDVVQKEMYTFDDKGGRSITLRPEGTAGIVRAFIENGMASWPSPLKLFYNMAMYRYENVQKGRLREFHQIGAEVFGTDSYLADFEIVEMANRIINDLNLPNIVLEINSIGCKECRGKYQEALKSFIGSKIDEYCDTCKSRFEKNTMRILDCKEKKCKENNANAPSIIDYLCENCKTHFINLQKLLDNSNIKYKINPRIVRGLDYYTKTVFEFVSEEEGYTIIGGGRYDYLIKELGGQDTSAIGFAIGMERVIELFKKYNLDKLEKSRPELYIAYIDDASCNFANKLKFNLRQLGIYVEGDILQRSLKAQLKYADKINAKYVIVIGENEIKDNYAQIKNMQTGNSDKIKLDENIIKQLYEKIIKQYIKK